MTESIDISTRRAYLKVLHRLASRDRLGRPYRSHSGASMARRFIRSGGEHSEALIRDMVRHGLLEIETQDGEESITMTSSGRDFLERFGP